MATYDLADVVTLAVAIRDNTGALANATAVTATITKPDGTTTAAAVANPSTGNYTTAYVPTAAGRQSDPSPTPRSTHA